jgi:uncharacterized protein (TIGR03437 family)
MKTGKWMHRVYSFGAICAIAALALLAMPANLLAVCGPGAKWTASCASGTDTLQLQLQAQIQLSPTAPSTTLPLSGTATIFRGSPSADGTTIPAEVVSINLTSSAEPGLTIQGGDGVANLQKDSSLYSPASITQSSTDPTQATVALDIFVQFQSQLIPGVVLHNTTPIHVQATVDRFPLAFNTTVNGPIQLLNAANVALITINSIAFSATLPAITPVVPPNSLVNGASYKPATQPNAAIAPGSIVVLFGTSLNDGQNYLSNTFGSDGKLLTTLGSSQVLINGKAVPVFYSFPTQLAVQIPVDLTGTSATYQVMVNGQASATQTVTVAPLSPGIFTLNQQGSGQGAILIATVNGVAPSGAIFAAPSGSVTGQNAQPVNRGDFISIFCTGLGAVSNQPPTGAPPPAGVISNTISSATVTIGGMTVPASFSGLTGFVGLYQVNVQVPSAAPTGDAIPVVVNIAGQTSNQATIAVQ